MPEPRLPPIDELNAQPVAAFAHALRPLFEAATPLAEALYARRPFASYASLIETAEHLSQHLDQPARIEVVNAHPRIGESAAVVRQTSTLSYREQGDPDAQADSSLQRLNAEYEQRFGFRFVVFVNRRPRAEIVNVLRARLSNPRDRELRTALAEIFRIARDRLHRLAPDDAS